MWKVNIVDPQKLTDELGEIFASPLIAVNVSATFIVHHGLYVDFTSSTSVFAIQAFVQSLMQGWQCDGTRGTVLCHTGTDFLGRLETTPPLLFWEIPYRKTIIGQNACLIVWELLLGGRCTVQKSRPNSNLGVIAPWVCTAVIVLTNKHTNKQTDAVENIQRSSLRYDVG